MTTIGLEIENEKLEKNSERYQIKAGIDTEYVTEIELKETVQKKFLCIGFDHYIHEFKEAIGNASNLSQET
ncbi:hypothetical protein BON23_5310 [Saccharomyces cerevisiae]|nr:hypothetical protein BON23_5310 [Saccharomyces cerevisiae]